MPSSNFGKNVKWYEKYWMRQYNSKYAPAPMFDSDNMIAKDAYRYIKETKRSNMTETERKTKISDIKYYRMRWAKTFAEINGSGADSKINEKVLAVLIPALKAEKKM